MEKYRKKPVVIEAKQWFKLNDHPEVISYPNDSIIACEKCGHTLTLHGRIKTLEGFHIVCVGDWIIKGIKGELYPCKPDIFKVTYEKITK